MARCPTCGSPRTDRFCSQCGNFVHSLTAQQSAPVRHNVPPVQAVSRQQRRSFAGVSVAILIGAALIALVRERRSSYPDFEPSQVSSPGVITQETVELEIAEGISTARAGIDRLYEKLGALRYPSDRIGPDVRRTDGRYFYEGHGNYQSSQNTTANSTLIRANAKLQEMLSIQRDMVAEPTRRRATTEIPSNLPFLSEQLNRFRNLNNQIRSILGESGIAIR